MSEVPGALPHQHASHLQPGSLSILAPAHKEIRVPCAWPEVDEMQNPHLFTSTPAEI